MSIRIINKACIFICPFLLAALALASLPGCTRHNNENGLVNVMVSILPQAEMAEEIGGGRVDVNVMIPPGESPHTFGEYHSRMIELSQADMYAAVGSGIEFEISLLDKIIALNPDMLVVDCSQGITLIQSHAHDHDDGETLSGEHFDPHIWLSLPNARIMAENIYHGLVEIDPEGESYYSSNLNSYFSRLDAAHQQALTDFGQIQNRVFMMYHPSMAYYARDYSLTQIAIEYEGKDPSPADLASLIEQARQFGVKVIFISPQFNPDSARVIADEIGGTVTFIDGLDRDYLANMIEITNLMIEAMAHDQG